MFGKFASLHEAYGRVRQAGADPFGVAFDEVVSPTTARIGGRDILLLGTNNYLGLTFAPEAIAAASDALHRYGTGTTGSRIANGTYAGHAELERRVARFLGRRDAMVFTTGHQANLGILATLAGREDHLLLDADSHASIYDGARLGSASVTRFRHNDPGDLARRLRVLADKPGDRLIVVEGLYSMLGDVAPLREIAAIKRETGAYLLVDEAHSLGVLGERGRGLIEAAGVHDDVDFVVGTFSKSLGSIGGFCASDHAGFDLLRLAARSYMFTASLPPSVVASVMTGFDLIDQRPQLRAQLSANAARLHAALAASGFRLGPSVSPIVSVRLRDPALAVTFWNRLLSAGIYVNLALPPATPEGESLLRSSVSAAHSFSELDRAAAIITAIGQELGIAGPQAAAAESYVSAAD